MASVLERLRLREDVRSDCHCMTCLTCDLENRDEVMIS